MELDPEFGLEQLHAGHAADDPERVLEHGGTVNLDLELVRNARLGEGGTVREDERRVMLSAHRPRICYKRPREISAQ